MKILIIAYYTFLRRLRDIQTLALMTVLPIVIIAILGTALNSFYSPKELKPVNVSYLNEDKRDFGKAFDNFLKMDEIKKFINVTKVSSYNEGKELLENGKVSGFIYIKNGFTEELLSDKKTQIEVMTNKNKEYENKVIEGIVESFTNGFNTQRALEKRPAQYSYQQLLVESPLSTEGKIPRAIDYYSVTMLVMVLMYGTLYGNYILLEDKINRTNIRMKSLPINNIYNFLGKTLGMIFTLFIDILIIVFFSKYVYGANWGNNILLIILISALFMIFTISLGILTGLFIKDENKSAFVLNFLVLFGTSVSGGYVKTEGAPKWFERLQFLSPNYYAHNALFNLIYGGDFARYILIILFLTIISFILAFLIGRVRINEYTD